MHCRSIGAVAAAMLLLGAAGPTSSDVAGSVLPNGWVLPTAADAPQRTETMPQGACLSPDGTTLAVVESGFNAPTLSLYATHDLRLLKRLHLAGAFGRPVWTRSGIVVAGANADAIFMVNPRTSRITKVRFPAKSYPVSVAVHGQLIAVATDGDGAVRVGKLANVSATGAIPVGARPGNLAFSGDGSKVFATVRSGSYVTSIDVHSATAHHIETRLHPSDVLVRGSELYVAEADADSIGIFDVQSGRRIDEVFVGAVPGSIGSSPNALAAAGTSIFVSLGAANEVAVLRDRRIVARFAAGWYPTDVVPLENRAFVIDGKGEGTKPNPSFDVMSRSYNDYVAAIEYGSIRVISLDSKSSSPTQQGQVGFEDPPPAQTIVRRDGPIKHVFFILKENRTYDQILGDVREGNGDPKLTWFGERVTPNQHALAARYGLFDDFYASGEVSDAGHNWADAAFANDYVERYWPPAYGRRRDDDDILSAAGAPVPHGGYLWDAARSSHVSFRDYGEMVVMPETGNVAPSTAPDLAGRFDPHYVGWNLDYSDLDRVKEWKREFDKFDSAGNVPQLEYLWLPNDHTYGSRPGKFTPAAYIATNDYAAGLIVQAISHSKIWPSSAIFITEDDAQDGADHVSDQRTTLYVASPYARNGLHHEHYSTLSVLRTMEILLGIKPLSTYDATAVPLYAAFGTTPSLQPFNALPPRIDVTAKNSKVAYGEKRSRLADFTKPDAVSPKMLTDILAHNRETAPSYRR